MKIFKIVLILLSVIGVALWLMLPDGDVPVEVASGDSNVNLMFVVSYILLGIAIVVTILFTIKGILGHHKLKQMITSLVVFGLVLVVSYLVASGDPILAQDGSVAADASTSKLVGAGLIAFYVLTVLAVVAMLSSGVKKVLFK
ncbi:hypothetical protein [Sinomicrobium sp.]